MTRSLSAFTVLSALFACSLVAQSKPLVTPKDYGKWETLGAARFSPNGAWLAYGIARVNEENDLRIRGGARDTTIIAAYGTQPAYSADSRWVGYLVTVAPKERDRLVKDKKPVHTSFAARNLTTGDTMSVSDVSAFTFSADGKFVALTKYAAEGKKTNDVLVQALATGTRLVFNNVSEQAWSPSAALLAFALTVDGGTGNGVQLYDGATGTVRVLDASSSVYRALSWRAQSMDLAVLRSRADKDFADTTHSVLAWTNASAPTSTPRVFDATGAPPGLRIADYRRPSWSKDGTVLYIGLRKREPTADQPKKSDDKVSDVEIWHPNDVHVIPEQRSSEQRDARSTLLASWRIGDARLLTIGTDVAETAGVLEGDKFAIEVDRKPYPFGQMFGRRDFDVWSLDLATGTRKQLLSKIRHAVGADPTGKRYAWFDGKDFWSIDIASGVRVNMTAPLTGAQHVDFVDRDDDHPTDVLPSIGAPGWSKDGTRLLAYAGYDIWSLAVDGSSQTKITVGAAEGIEYRLVSLAGPGASVADRAIDLSKPMYLAMYGKRTKQSGYAMRAADGTITRLVYADAAVARLVKADSADKYAYTRNRFDESPNVFVGGADFSNAKAMSATNAFQKDYAWGKAELMNFTSTIGKPLQAILYYPANYDASKKYPLIVYTYELLSQDLHRYIAPRETDYYNANVFTQNGYFVLMPDIVFRPREPGVAVLQAVEPAVRAVIARGLVDAANVGHVGHSQGGYEAAYLATHSTLFKTAVMGSGISDMISFAGQMHWSSVPEFDHWETGQFRMQVAPWEDMPAMIKNSPLDKIHVMPAKSMLVEIGGEDPTVDMRQGVEFYNYARRAGKNVVMLLYPGEGHGLGKKENQVDYERRILQWFGHFLKGEAAPKWITEGQSWLERKKALEANK